MYKQINTYDDDLSNGKRHIQEITNFKNRKKKIYIQRNLSFLHFRVTITTPTFH